jgi:hypothetical protein
MHHRDPLRRGPLERVHHDELLHDRLVDRGGVALDDEGITSAHRLLVSDEDLAVGEVERAASESAASPAAVRPPARASRLTRPAKTMRVLLGLLLDARSGVHGPLLAAASPLSPVCRVAARARPAPRGCPGAGPGRPTRRHCAAWPGRRRSGPGRRPWRRERTRPRHTRRRRRSTGRDRGRNWTRRSSGHRSRSCAWPRRRSWRRSCRPRCWHPPRWSRHRSTSGAGPSRPPRCGRSWSRRIRRSCRPRRDRSPAADSCTDRRTRRRRPSARWTSARLHLGTVTDLAVA